MAIRKETKTEKRGGGLYIFMKKSLQPQCLQGFNSN